MPVFSKLADLPSAQAVYSNVRSYFNERMSQSKLQWKIFQQEQKDPDEILARTQDSENLRIYNSFRSRFTERQQKDILDQEFQNLRANYETSNQRRNEPFEFYEPRDLNELPENRLPQPGIRAVPLKYHKGQTTVATDEVPESGFKIDPLLQELLIRKYPEYLWIPKRYCRPLGTTDATFSDFNREQKPSLPIPTERKERILSHILKRLHAEPYLPLHFVDTQWAKLPLPTGTGYNNRHNYKTNAHANFSHPKEYADKRTSKGYYINAFLEKSRTLVHFIKDQGYPFLWTWKSETPSDDEMLAFMRRLNRFFNEYPTLLFTRNHISDRDGNLKQRPVYAVDELFILLEIMLTFPLLVQARAPECCIMYGLETIRGSSHYIDSVAKSYDSFFTIDWSQFDQRLPRVITDIYYTDFLERLIVINHGYQPTYDYPTYPDLTPEMMFERMDNTLNFLHTWYNNMTFLSLDGFAYRRTHAGVPSGLFNTQYLDSFGNLFLILDGFMEYGFSDDQIDAILLFVMGDDNSGMTPLTITSLSNFLTWFETYALARYNMVLSKTKSVITIMRSKIETLSYAANNGNPIRPVEKLVAQLLYPERGLDARYMSARSIGLAYASAGSDRTFYALCRDVYHTFLPYADLSSDIDLMRTKSMLPGYLKALDPEDIPFSFMEFPTLDKIRQQYSKYLGPLDYAPKWNYAHFINSPNVIPPSSQTMHEYRMEHNIPRQDVPCLPEDV
uniref:RNA dependent RNA polymerase n=1 Tax=Rosellinia necatrix partitivirus 16 TaxID=2699384 RepID=A0A6F8QGM3_9VIRU|nr:RNA dependent RNA polymerase [Rosellinia necatrix partitivirus 16]